MSFPASLQAVRVNGWTLLSDEDCSFDGALKHLCLNRRHLRSRSSSRLLTISPGQGCAEILSMKGGATVMAAANTVKA
jgi:hypothetical protein